MNDLLNKIRFSIEHGGDVNQAQEDGKTLLDMAAWEGKREDIQVILEARVNIEAKDDLGFTALDLAKENNHKEAISLLESCAL